MSLVWARYRFEANVGYTARSPMPSTPATGGLGIATAIGTELLHFAFDSLKLHRVAASCDPRNEASAAVLRKIGMAWEGRLRDTIELRDGWRDSDLFSILAGEPLPASRWRTHLSPRLATQKSN